MIKKKNFWLCVLDILEVYIPAVLFMILFICFLVGIFFRYVIKNPQSWAFELSTVTFLGSVILSGCLSDRLGEHISFDMIYAKKTERTKMIMRIISNSLITVFLGASIPASVRFVLSFNNLTTPIMKIPQSLVFCCFPILLADFVIRSAVHLVGDIKGLVRMSSGVSKAIDDSEVVE